MAVERNPFAEQGNVINMDSGETIEYEIESDDPSLQVEEILEEEPYDHYENIIYSLDKDELLDIATKVIDAYEADKESRADWEETFERGFDLLGLKLEEAFEPFEGACTAVHPLIIESSVKFQAKAIQELFPAKGPVKAQVVGHSTPEKEQQANRVQNFMNYQLTDQMPEYFDELERMLFHLPVFGSAIKKCYFDPALDRPVSEFITIDQFVVSNNAPDLRKAERYTHLIYRSPNDLKRDIVNGFYGLPDYTEEELPEPMEIVPTNLRQKMDTILGMSPDYTSSPQYTLLEHHCYLELESDEEEDSIVVALPYIVTVDKDTKTVLAIRRNWREDDARKEKLTWFTHYKFVPGFGFYGLGYIHFLGNLTASATAAMRNLIDAGQFSNLPGGFKARGVRVVGANDPIAPGEFREVEATGVDLTKAIVPLPYKEPSNTLMQMLQFVASTGQKFADTTEQVIADSTNYGPVGTTLALLEASTKFFSAIHKRLHHSQRDELHILARINHDYLPDEYPYDIPFITGNIFKSDFDGRVDIIPVSDPNVPSSAHRIAVAQMILQLASQSPPGMYNMREVNRTILDSLNIAEPTRFLTPEKPEPKPLDPISDIRQAVEGNPIKAFPGQDHKAHITIKESFIADPTLGQNPLMAQIVPVLQANIREHMILQYEEQISGMLEKGIEAAGVASPQAIAQITQGAAEEILENNQRMAEQGTVEDLERMTIELQRQQLELEKEKVKLDALHSTAKITLDEQKLELDRDEFEIDSADKLAKLKSTNENKTKELDDKFLLEVFKTMMKETKTSVEKLKETVDLRKYNEGGIVEVAETPDLMKTLRDFFGPLEGEVVPSDADFTPTSPTSQEMVPASEAEVPLDADTTIPLQEPVQEEAEFIVPDNLVPPQMMDIEEEKVSMPSQFEVAPRKPISDEDREKLEPHEIDAGTYETLIEEIQPKSTSRDDFLKWMDAIHANESSRSHYDSKGKVKVSKAGAIGGYQLTPVGSGEHKFSGFSPTEEMLRDPEYNKWAGHTYGSYLLDKFDGSQRDAAVAYNWGEGNARAWIENNRTLEKFKVPKRDKNGKPLKDKNGKIIMKNIKIPNETLNYLKKMEAQLQTGEEIV